eukprot:s3006_g6.t1
MSFLVKYNSKSAKKILKNFQEPENLKDCKGEALLLHARLQECEAASLVFELGHGSSDAVCQADVKNAVALLKDVWHIIPLGLKAVLAQRQITVHIQSLLKFCSKAQDEDGDEDEQEDHDLNDFLEPIVLTIFPLTDAEDVVFDAHNPTMHAVCADLIYKVSEELDMTEVDPDEPGELDLPFRKAAKAVFGSGPGYFFR